MTTFRRAVCSEETGDAVWSVTKLDRSALRVGYLRVEPDRYVAQIDVRCRGVGGRRTEVTILYSFVGLSCAGNREIDAMTQEAYEEKMARWTIWISNHLKAQENGPRV